jgi:hypothetical protein
MVVGARTIKAYAWENHYFDKIKAARNGQVWYLFSQAMISGLGIAFFMNGGLLVLNNIFFIQWSRGEKLDQGVSMSIMAIIFYIFLSVNCMTYFGLTIYQQFMSCVQRISEVTEMEEFVFNREVEVINKEEVHLKFKNADIGWGFRVKQESA